MKYKKIMLKDMAKKIDLLKKTDKEFKSINDIKEIYIGSNADGEFYYELRYDEGKIRRWFNTEEDRQYTIDKDYPDYKVIKEGEWKGR